MKMTLTPAQYKDLVYRVADGGYDEDAGKPYPFYTGRGMVGYGEPSRTCFGWVTGRGGAGAVQLELARIWLTTDPNALDIEQSTDLDWDTVMDEVATAISQIGEPSTDSMGRDVIYYWRNIEVDPSVRSEED